MSSYEDRAREIKTAREEAQAIKRLESSEQLKAHYRQGQGEFIGDMAGGFGSFVGSRPIQLLVAGIKTTMLIGAGAVAIAALYQAL